MTWNLTQHDLSFFFQEQSQDGVTRDRLHRMIAELREMDDPSKYDGLYSCSVHEDRHVAKIKDTRKLLFFKIHRDNAEEVAARHSIELIAIVDPDNLL